MSDVRTQIADAADALFALSPAWPQLVEAGFPLLLVPQARGGIGGNWGDAAAVMQAAGATALAQPLGEAMLANYLLVKARQVVPQGLTSIGSGEGRLTAGRFSGFVAAVPFGRDADHVLATIGADGQTPQLVLLPRGIIAEGISPAGEPRDRLDYAGTAVERLGDGDHMLFAAFLRTAQTAGALSAALALAVVHVGQRVQFGKALAGQQAVQQALAVLAEEVAAVKMAVAAAAAALDRGGGIMEMMAARLRGNVAIHRGVPIAHQVHGAIGFTADYPLQRYTRRLMGWRSDFGGDRWAEQLGAGVLDASGAELWTDITRRGDL